MYDIEIDTKVLAFMDAEFRSFDQKAILDGIEDQLSHEPTKVTRKRKILEDFEAPSDWNTNPPVWQLSIGEFRVFYDVDEKQKAVFVRAVRRKPAHRTTKEIV